MKRSNGLVRRARRLAFAALGLLCWLLLPRPVAALPLQAASPAAALACDAHQFSLSFSLQSDGAGGAALQPPAGPNAALDVGLARLAVVCQAVFAVGATGAGTTFDLPAGSVTFTVSGPGMFVESAAQSVTVACGSVAQNLPCTGAVPGGEANLTGTAALTVHVVLLPLAALPPLPADGAIAVSVAYQEDPALGDAGAAASAAIDLAPPRYAAQASVDRAVVTSGVNAGAVVTVQVRHALAEGCAPLGGGPYLFCTGESLQPGDAGAEPGTVTFTTNLGLFPNGASTIAAACDASSAGGASAAAGETPPALTAPPPGVDTPFRYSCSSVGVRLASAGFAGEATVSIQFTGALTGATAQAGVTVTIAPGPATLQLIGGCTPAQAPRSLPAAAPIEDLVGSISPSSAVVSIWRHDPEAGWQALFLRGGGPVDGATVEPGEPLFICVDALAQYPLG